MPNTQDTNDAFGAQKGFLGYATRLREALCAKNRLLWYGRDIRYQKPPPTVRDASSGAFGAQNRLLRYGRDIRYRKHPPTVRDAFSEAFGVKNTLLRYGMKRPDAAIVWLALIRGCDHCVAGSSSRVRLL